MINSLKRLWSCQLWGHKFMYFEMNEQIKKEMITTYIYVKKCPVCEKEIVLGTDNTRSVLNAQ